MNWESTSPSQRTISRFPKPRDINIVARKVHREYLWKEKGLQVTITFLYGTWFENGLGYRFFEEYHRDGEGHFVRHLQHGLCRWDLDDIPAEAEFTSLYSHAGEKSIESLEELPF